jgi:hypothetical protein
MARFQRLDGKDVYLPDRDRRAWPEDVADSAKSEGIEARLNLRISNTAEFLRHGRWSS